jgi:transketolase
LILSRQSLPVLNRKIYPSAVTLAKGAYILADTPGTPDVILIGSGSEVHPCLEARETLARKGVAARVVSMPSWELFERTSKSYKDKVLPPSITARVSVEAGVPMGWERYVGDLGEIVGINRFGASAPGGTIMQKYGMKASAVAAKAMAVLKQK